MFECVAGGVESWGGSGREGREPTDVLRDLSGAEVVVGGDGCAPGLSDRMAVGKLSALGSMCARGCDEGASDR